MPSSCLRTERKDPLNGCPEPATPATKVDYERALCILPKIWPWLAREHGLRDPHALALQWMLGNVPSGFTMRIADRVEGDDLAQRHTRGLCDSLQWGRGKGNTIVAQLRRAGLVSAHTYRKRRADRVPLQDGRLGRWPRSNLFRVYVAVERILSLVDPSDGSILDPSTGSPRDPDPATPKPPSKRTRRPRRRDRMEGTTPEASPESSRDAIGAAGESAPASAQAPDEGAYGEQGEAQPPAPDERAGGTGEHAAGQADAEPADVDEAQIARLCSSWDALEIPQAGGAPSTTHRASERSAIANRARELGVSMVATAIIGAGADPWLRRDPRRSAIAWVFRPDGSGVRHYAELGAEILAEAERAKRAKAEAAARERALDYAHRRELAERNEKYIAWRKAEASGMNEEQFAAWWAAERAVMVVAGDADPSTAIVAGGAPTAPRRGAQRVAVGVARAMVAALSREADRQERRDTWALLDEAELEELLENDTTKGSGGT